MATLMWTKSKDQQQPAARRPPKTAAVDIRCRKHPKQRQSPGVCSACLREKLCQLPSKSSSSSFRNADYDHSTISTNSSLSSYCSSSSCSSSRASPPRRRREKGGNSNGKGRGGGGGRMLSLSEVLKLGSGHKKNDRRDDQAMVMRKSRSMAVVATAERDGDGGEGRKKKGFWSILRRRKGAEEARLPTRLGHSMTMRDVFLVTSG